MGLEQGVRRQDAEHRQQETAELFQLLLQWSMEIGVLNTFI